MKVVCIDINFTNKLSGSPTLKLEEPLEYGKVYTAELVFENTTSWNNNYLILEGFSELDWLPTKNFVQLEVWREKLLDNILL